MPKYHKGLTHGEIDAYYAGYFDGWFEHATDNELIDEYNYSEGVINKQIGKLNESVNDSATSQYRVINKHTDKIAAIVREQSEREARR